MKSRFYSLILITTFSLCLATACENEELEQRPYPRMKTLAVNNITEQGATFNAEILLDGVEDVVEYGFVWSVERINPNIHHSNRLIYKKAMGEGKFSDHISTTLMTDTTYNVRAFAKTQNHTIYGDLVKFKSKGSGAPKVHSVLSESGITDDVVIIKGSSFSYVWSENKVFIGGVEAYRVPLTTTDTTITVRVPKRPLRNPKQAQVKVVTTGKTSTDEVYFTYLD